jgi:hypothetical protein
LTERWKRGKIKKAAEEKILCRLLFFKITESLFTIQGLTPFLLTAVTTVTIFYTTIVSDHAVFPEVPAAPSSDPPVAAATVQAFLSGSDTVSSVWHCPPTCACEGAWPQEAVGSDAVVSV